MNSSAAIAFKPAKFKRKLRTWQPEWKPEYEAIVAESCMGKANTVLASKYGFTEQHISNILNTEQARKIKEEAIATIRRSSMHLMDATIASNTDKALENITTVLNKPELLVENPFAIFDKSLAFLKGVGKLAGEGSTVINDNRTQNQVQQNFLNMSPEQADTFQTGLNKALNSIEKHKELKGVSIN
jgi:hypothetical protein